MLARYHCTKKTRPAAKPRFGSVIERLFGTTNTQLIFNLLGNTQAIQEPTGFAHVLIYGPSGVGKTTMIRQISRRLCLKIVTHEKKLFSK